MLDTQTAQERAAALVERACEAGADAADVVYSGDSSESISVRLGQLEDVERSESEQISLRVFVGHSSASIGSSDLGDAALDELAMRAVAMARLAPEDRFSGLAPDEMLLRGPSPELDLVDPVEPSPAQLRELARETEDAARAVKGVTNSEGAGASSGRGVFALATSHGFARAYSSTSHGLSASVIAGEGAGMQRDYAWRSARHASDLPSAQEVGQQAGTRTVARLAPGRVNSGAMAVVFDPRIGGTLISSLLGAISGSAIARGASFLLGKEDVQIFDSAVTIIDNPLMLRGQRSRPFDGEGLPTAPRTLVEGGRLTGWLMDSAAARQLGGVPTGHASRGGGAPVIGAGNVHIEPGSLSPAELMADIADGIYVTELIGMGVNAVTGDYSRGAAGFRIVGGEIAGPVAEFTIAGNLIEMYAALTPANDLEWHRAINVPTLRVDGMMIAGD
ncbi:MAG: TldD/PmbA family protein [Novosphingobium sp.]